MSKEIHNQMIWKPIKTAPRDGTTILLKFGSDGVSQAKYVKGHSKPWKFIDQSDGLTWLINRAADDDGGPSHWMPMPTTTPQQTPLAQEPVAICPNCLGTKRPHADDPDWRGRCDCTEPAVQPKQQEWVGLTPDDISLLEKENTVGGYHGDYCPTWDLIEAVEARLKEKNT